MRRIALATALSATALAVTASPGGAVVTVGQVPGAPPSFACGSNERVQPTVTGGASYVAPANGKITSWSTFAGPAGGNLKLKVFRPVAGVANNYSVVGQDAIRGLTANTPHTFPVDIAVQKGDLVGSASTALTTNCAFSVTGETYFRSGMSDTANGGIVAITLPIANSRLNISAVLDPTNTFTLGGTTRNKKKGTATLTVNVPNPGELAVSGDGVKTAAGAQASATVTAPGEVTLLIKAKGKKKKKLNSTGKVKVNPKVTYTPTGGDPSTQSLKVNLKKKL